MSMAFEGRMQRLRATAHDAEARSERVIWCFEAEKMPAMIDLLIAQGRLDEADRPHCVHWTAVRGPGEFSAEDAVKTVDADEMLQAAGLRTLTEEARDALRQGMPAFEAFMQDRFGGLDPDERAQFEKLERTMRPHPPSPP